MFVPLLKLGLPQPLSRSLDTDWTTDCQTSLSLLRQQSTSLFLIGQQFDKPLYLAWPLSRERNTCLTIFPLIGHQINRPLSDWKHACFWLDNTITYSKSFSSLEKLLKIQYMIGWLNLPLPRQVGSGPDWLGGWWNSPEEVVHSHI